MNHVSLIGRLTRDPELSYTQSGTAVARLSLAVDRPFAKDGQQDVDFINIVVWKAQAEACVNNLVKGQQIAVEGRLQVRPFTDKQGQKRTAAEVVANRVQFLAKPNGTKKTEVAEVVEEDTAEEEVPF